jgi:hypothetical protein
MNAVYADAEVRGRLRQWKTALAVNYRRLDRLFTSGALNTHVVELCSRSSSTGRQRAFAKVAKRIATTGATLDGVRLDGRAPCAVWSILKPRDSVAVDPDDPSDPQNCITVNYVYLGDVDGVPHQADGLWTLEIPDHALGRLLHRSGAVDPAARIAAAHHAALRLRAADVFPSMATDSDFRFLVPAGPGAFVCGTAHGPDVSIDHQMSVHVRALTWLSTDMLRDDQVPLIDDGAPGNRLGDSWLMPAPLRRIDKGPGGMAQVLVRVPGLPDLMATPKGRA